jgi:hypothetical protein
VCIAAVDEAATLLAMAAELTSTCSTALAIMASNFDQQLKQHQLLL